MKWLFFGGMRFWVKIDGEYTQICTDQPLTIKTASTNAPQIVWTQVSGDPVTITNANTLTPTINVGYGYDSPTPLILRLTDASDPFVYADIEIATKLTDRQGSPSLGISSADHSACLRNVKIVPNTAFFTTPALVPSAYVFGDRSTIHLSWLSPTCSQELITEYKVQANLQGYYQTVATYGINPDIWHHPVQLGVNYRIVTVFGFAGNTYEIPGEVFGIDPAAFALNVTVLGDEPSPLPSLGSSTSTFSDASLTFFVGLLSRDEGDPIDATPSLGASASSFTPVNLLFYSLLNELNVPASPDTDEVPASSLGTSITTFVSQPVQWSTSGVVI